MGKGNGYGVPFPIRLSKTARIPRLSALGFGLAQRLLEVSEVRLAPLRQFPWDVRDTVGNARASKRKSSLVMSIKAKTNNSSDCSSNGRYGDTNKSKMF